MKDLWPVAEAKKILEHQEKRNDSPIVFETGYGPSGLPHIGTFAEVARTVFVMEALHNLAPEKKTKLITFSDDLDGLRELPQNIPDHERLREHLGKPLSDIPDPFKKEKSYSESMNLKLKEFLDSFGITYEFKSSTESYRSGEFDQGLDLIFENYEAIKSIFVKTISEEKREAWSPFFMVCENCGKINTTRVLQPDFEKKEILYVCDQSSDTLSACGNQSQSGYGQGRAKVGWKVDWALRWHMLNVAYEMHGEDLTESVKVSAKISRLLGGKAPLNFKYDLFLDENNQKISKKKGNGISMEQWMRYSPLAALLHFLLSNPNKPKKMGLPILPQIVDEFFGTLRKSDPDSPNSPIWFIRKFPKAILPSRSGPLSYTLLTNVCKSLSIEDAEVLYEYAKKYDPEVDKDRDFYFGLCEQVVSYVREFVSAEESEEVAIDSNYFPLLERLISYLQKIEETDERFNGNDLQTEIFTIAKENSAEPRSWFQFLYAVMLGQTQGPKIGHLIALLGKEKSLELLNQINT